MNDLSRLDAPSFHSRLGELLRVEFSALGAFLQALVAFDQRRLFRDLGYASLFEYLNRGLGLSRAAAHHRRSAAGLIQKFPEVLRPIEQGKLCFTTASILATVMTGENRAEVLPRFFGLSKQEALEVAAELRPRAVVPARTVVTRKAQDEITGEFGRIVRPGELWAPRTGGEPGTTASPAMVVDSSTTVVPMTATASRLHVTVSREFLSLLKKAKAGESHRNPNATDEQILKLALEALIEKQSKRKASVPAKVKREVVARDGGKCQWKLPDGEICGATAMLEIDHVVPRGKGGPSTTDNCRVTCRAHNLEAARREYGDETMDLYTRSGCGPIAREEVAAYAPSPAHPARPAQPVRPTPGPTRDPTLPAACARGAGGARLGATPGATTPRARGRRTTCAVSCSRLHAPGSNADGRSSSR